MSMAYLEFWTISRIYHAGFVESHKSETPPDKPFAVCYTVNERFIKNGGHIMPDKKTIDQRAAAKNFAEYWAGKGYEKGQSQTFWLSLLHDVYGVEHPGEFISV